jgi:hypothetical protein
MSPSNSRIFRSKRHIAAVTAFVAAGAAAVVAAPALSGGSGISAAPLVAHDSPAHEVNSTSGPRGSGSDVLSGPAALAARPAAYIAPQVAVMPPPMPTNTVERASRSDSRKSLTAGTTSGGSPQAIAQSKLAARGWSGQFGCLSSLWSKESGWKTSAHNSSGAYGIPQALPGSKMASAGADWQTNPATQIEWGLHYISSTYGTPCAAWSHSQADNWY